jgi:integrase
MKGRERKNPKGVYEKVPGSDVWSIRYADSTGRIRRETVGLKSAAIKLYRKRKTEVLERKKLPENFRVKAVTFGELADDAMAWSRANKISWRHDATRLKIMRKAFGYRPADSITPQEFERLFTAEGMSSHRDRTRKGKPWKPATFNRHKALVSLVYRQGIKNRKVQSNPAREIERRKENNARERYLSDAEEVSLRKAITAVAPERVAELEIALHTGMRRSEQYQCEWSWVNFDLRILTIPRSKNGEKRTVVLNDVAVLAFRALLAMSDGTGRVFGHLYRSEDTIGPRNWFERALRQGGISSFRWHDLRHTFASRLVMRGVDIVTVSHLMGHKSIQITMRYAHLAPQHKLEAVQRLCETGTAQKGATDTKTDTDLQSVAYDKAGAHFQVSENANLALRVGL